MERSARLYVNLAVPFLFVLPVLNWAGWLWDIPVLQRGVPEFDAMHPATALGMLVSGFGILLLSREPLATVSRGLALGCALIVVAIGVAGGAEWLLGLDTGLDRMLPGTLAPGVAPAAVVSIATSLGLLSAGVALVLFVLDRGEMLVAAQVATFAVLIVGIYGTFIYAVGHLPNVPATPSHGLSLLTAISLVVLALGLAALRPFEGPLRYVSSDDLVGSLARRILLAAVGGTLLVAVLRVSGEYYYRAYQSNTGTVLMATAMLSLFLLLIWSGARLLNRADRARRQAVAERIGAEAARKQADSELRRFFEVSLDMMCIASGGYFRRVSPAFTQVLGWSAEELTSRPLFDFIHPEDVSRTEEVVQRQVEHGESILQFQNRYQCKDGGYRVLSWKSVPRPDGTLYAAARDITEQTAVQEQLARERGLLKTFVETAADGIFTTDERGTVLNANDAACGMFQYTREELIGRDVRFLMAPPDSEEHSAHIERYLRTGDSSVIGVKRERNCVRKDGTVFPVELTIGEVSSHSSRVFTGILRDITDRREYEQALVDAVTEANRANQAKSQFLSRMSHELRTPLNSVLGFAQIIDLQYDDPRLKEMVRYIVQGGEHLLELINDVLDVTRIESGRLPISLETVCAGKVINDAVALVQPLADDASVTVKISEACQDVFVRADRQRLLQALINLVANAIKYNRKGGRVDVRCHCPDDGRCRIDVTDTGRGIPDSFLPQLFEPFERLDQEHTSGTGLGLALSRQLVRLMEGDIELTNTSPDGSTFTISLEIASEPLTAPEGAEAKTSRTAQTPARPMQILVIEDNLANLNLLEHVFANWSGLELLSTMQGRMGLDMARQHGPDAILLDLHLPDIGGEEVLRSLKASPETSGIPVVIVSADATPSQIDHLLSLGAVQYLTKPIDVSLLTDTMYRVLDPDGTNPGL